MGGPTALERLDLTGKDIGEESPLGAWPPCYHGAA